MTPLRKVSIGFAVAGILVIVGNYIANIMGVSGRVDRILFVFPLFFIAIVLKYYDSWRSKNNNKK